MPKPEWLKDLDRLYQQAQDGTPSMKAHFRDEFCSYASRILGELREFYCQRDEPKKTTIADYYPPGGLREPSEQEIELNNENERLVDELYQAHLAVRALTTGNRDLRSQRDALEGDAIDMRKCIFDLQDAAQALSSDMRAIFENARDTGSVTIDELDNHYCLSIKRLEMCDWTTINMYLEQAIVENVMQKDQSS